MRKISYAESTRLINQGQRMSNWLYNIAQPERVPADLRQEAKLLIASWDQLRSGQRFLLGERTRKASGSQPTRGAQS